MLKKRLSTYPPGKQNFIRIFRSEKKKKQSQVLQKLDKRHVRGSVERGLCEM